MTSDGYRLTLITASLFHTARYTCISTNEAGAAEKDFDLDVLGKPHLLQPNKYQMMTIPTCSKEVCIRYFNVICPQNPLNVKLKNIVIYIVLYMSMAWVMGPKAKT